ncbi:hypothetical protein E1A91_A06G073400v1 [Gossypium mustelinum]|uniref:Protein DETOXIFICATION n=1 Tax=Gossypium mustelinum TaxID=34275 RepID=A0A5D2YSP9_GOSMU|nr:hypothetical protein E1A91_A06G073400v1 [Gossypium mustelinum]
MCNQTTTASILTSTQNSSQTHLYFHPGKHRHHHDHGAHHLCASISDIITEAKSLFNLAFPIALTGLILYSRSIISMLFLGHLGDIQLAAGSLAIAFANVTGYSVLSGLALDPNITRIGQRYLLFSLLDLFTNSFIHPIRIYLRAQGITHPLTLATLAATILHLPISFLLVSHFNLGVAGVAASASISNFFVLVSLVVHIWASGLHHPTWEKPTLECLTGWKPLLKLAAPSCVSVCLEWWWYEIMIVMCGLLVNPKAPVASMGILIQTTSLLYVFPSSLGFAVSTRVGNELGANRLNKARLSAVVAVFVSAMMGLSASTFASGMRNKWARMFTSDPEILRLTSIALPILGLCELGNCPQTVGCGVLRGSARPSTAANVNLGAFYLVGMPVAVGLGFYVGVGFSGVWLGLLSAQVCCAGLMLYVVGSTDWDLQAKRAQMLTCVDTTWLPHDFDNNSKGEEEQQPLICSVLTSAA